MPRDANGRFLPGPDPDRHELTAAERKRGYAAARNHADPRVAAWIWRRMRSRYRAAKQWFPASRGDSAGAGQPRDDNAIPY